MIRFALAFSVLASAAQAQSVKLQDYEIRALLTGNTAVGVSAGAAYRQYFSPDGATIYAAENARSTRDEWRVVGDEYQSLWPGQQDWEGWYVMEYAGDFFWVSKTTPPTPFRLLDGEQLVAP